MQRLTFRFRHHTTSWLALWALVAVLGQAVLPTLAFLRAGTEPTLWTEICSVYGSKAVTPSTDPGQNPATQHHADCPLCLQVFHDFILDTPEAAAPSTLMLPMAVQATVTRLTVPTGTVLLPEARAPPKLA